MAGVGAVAPGSSSADTFPNADPKDPGARLGRLPDMDFALTQEHDLIRQSARQFAEREIAPGIRERDRAAKADPESIHKMGQAGLLGVSIPAKYGGQDTDYISLGLVSEELERVDSTARVVISVHVGLNSLSMLQWGNEDQRQRFLVPQARGEKIAAFALTEPNAGSDVLGMRSTAVRDGDHYVLNGEKTWISLANIADNFLVFAYTDREARHRGITAFVVERGMDGFSSTAIHGKLGVRAGDTGSIMFQDMRVPLENRIGEEGEGFKIAMASLDNGRYTVAAGSVGIIVACLEASAKYCHERKTAGVEIGKHQLVQQMIANMVAGREIGRLLYYKVGWLKNKGERCTREVSLAKWTNCNNAFQAANDAVEIHGAYGYCDDFPVERYLRNSRGSVIYEGTREIHTLMQAEYELGYREDRPLNHPLPGWPFTG